MWGLLSTSAVEGEGGCQGCAFQDFEAVLLSLQAGHTVGSPATCGPWGWCSSPCSTASSPSTTAYLRSSSAKSRLPSTPSLSEYSLPFLPGHRGLTGPAGAGGAPLSTPRVTAVLTTGCCAVDTKKQEQGWDSLWEGGAGSEQWWLL